LLDQATEAETEEVRGNIECFRSILETIRRSKAKQLILRRLLGRYHRHREQRFQARERRLAVYTDEDAVAFEKQLHAIRIESVQLMENLHERIETYERIVVIEYAVRVREKDLGVVRDEGGGLLQEHPAFASEQVGRLKQTQAELRTLRIAVIGNLKELMDDVRSTRALGTASAASSGSK